MLYNPAHAASIPYSFGTFPVSDACCPDHGNIRNGPGQENRPRTFQQINGRPHLYAGICGINDPLTSINELTSFPKFAKQILGESI